MLPNETLVCSDGRILERRQIAPLPEGPPETVTEERALVWLDRALRESVDLHQRSDVPYGMFLSGGNDRAALLTQMAQMNSQPVEAERNGFKP